MKSKQEAEYAAIVNELDELEADMQQKEQELRNVKDEVAELMSELDKAKLDETQMRDMLEKEREEALSLETECIIMLSVN